MKEFNIAVHVSSDRNFKVYADSSEEARALVSDLLEYSDILTNPNMDVEKVTVSCEESQPEKGRAPMERLLENLSLFCEEQGYTPEEIKEMMEELCWDKEIDPALYLDFRPICAFETEGGDGLLPPYRHQQLFGKNGCLLDSAMQEYSSSLSDITQSYEIWLLEDMTLAVTFCCEMAVEDGNGYRESAAYRHPVSEGYASLTGEFYADDFLEAVSDRILEARCMD